MEINLQPTLIGPTLKLRPLKSDDFDELYACASDPKIWEQHPQNDRYKKDVFKKIFEEALDCKGAFAIFDRAKEKIIGSSRFYNLDLAKREITIGYTFLTTEYWGGSFNRELKHLMLNHAFQFADLARFDVGTHNLRSRKAMEKIGGRLIGSSNINNQPRVTYGIRREDFIGS